MLCGQAYSGMFASGPGRGEMYASRHACGGMHARGKACNGMYVSASRTKHPCYPLAEVIRTRVCRHAYRHAMPIQIEWRCLRWYVCECEPKRMSTLPLTRTGTNCHPSRSLTPNTVAVRRIDEKKGSGFPTDGRGSNGRPGFKRAAGVQTGGRGTFCQYGSLVSSHLSGEPAIGWWTNTTCHTPTDSASVMLRCYAF